MDGTRKEERESVYNEFSIIYINNNSFIWYMPFIKELLKYSNQYFIETGTYKGDTVEWARNMFLYNSLYLFRYLTAEELLYLWFIYP